MNHHPPPRKITANRMASAHWVPLTVTWSRLDGERPLHHGDAATADAHPRDLAPPLLGGGGQATRPAHLRALVDVELEHRVRLRREAGQERDESAAGAAGGGILEKPAQGREHARPQSRRPG